MYIKTHQKQTCKPVTSMVSTVTTPYKKTLKTFPARTTAITIYTFIYYILYTNL